MQREERQVKNEIASTRYLRPNPMTYSKSKVISTAKLAPPLNETELIQSLVLRALKMFHNIISDNE